MNDKKVWCLAAALLCSGLGGTDFASAKDAKSGNMFMGNYGYILEYPADYTALPGFDDPEKTMERVLIYPKRAPATELEERHYAKHGIVRVEVAPIIARTPDGNFRAGLKELTQVIPQALERGGEKCAVSKFKSRFPAAKLTITGKIPLVQVVVEGAKVTYIFTAAKDDARLRSLIGSLKELAPSEKPGR